MNPNFERCHSSIRSTIYKLELLSEILPCNSNGCKLCDFHSLCDRVYDAIDVLTDVDNELEKR